ncbi:hypothetical protein Bpfe_013096 [Biomphalaria pfeifferi]|uniref:Uncharacterized protein n=1 Tax=Biomphalaria pfeifferi TaxID=112525 RepID=A0AAD8BP00_BIOPF|nr:hypothetical protein Bpfe_013096 [Biomphalaria pfeifferi]
MAHRQNYSGGSPKKGSSKSSPNPNPILYHLCPYPLSPLPISSITSAHILYHLCPYPLSPLPISSITSAHILYHLCPYPLSSLPISSITSAHILYHLCPYPLSSLPISSITSAHIHYHLCPILSASPNTSKGHNNEIYFIKLVKTSVDVYLQMGMIVLSLYPSF